MLRDYVKIARPDHWFKNVFMLPGMLLGWFASPPENNISTLGWVFLGIMATCLICSSNYTINEFLDAATDRKHPEKRNRPAASGRVNKFLVYNQWLLLAAVGLSLSWFVGWQFFTCGLVLFLMGIIYNVPPVRSKDIPYLDVLSESINNPIRLLLGWYSVKCQLLPPATLIFAYWMLGAFLMAVKRFAELGHINDSRVAMAYRKSFVHYTPERLLISIIFFSTAFSFFSGAFIIKYHIELILAVPYFAGFIGFYLHLGMLPDSPAQHPESLHKERAFVIYTGLTVLMTIICFFLHIPWLGRLFESTIPGGF
jgi:4-hydroxybenzoate polyprenyltransferase